MDSIAGLFYGLGIALQPQNLLFCFLGCFVGTLIGVLPGLGPGGALALLLPVTFALPPSTAIIMLSGIYYGAMYGGSTTSILINIPGEAASVVTCLDGYQMARKGRAGPALGMAAIASFIAGTISLFGLLFLAPPFANFALKFSSPEYVSLIICGLILVSFLGAGSKLKAFMMGTLGLLLGTIGTDPIEGIDRFSFGIPHLMDGVGLIPVIMGLFGISEILANLEEEGFVGILTEKIKKISIEPKAGQTAGLICNGIANNHDGPPVCKWHVIAKGKPVENADSTVEIQKFGPDDVMIKGANAVDMEGNAGIWTCGVKGGTIGMCWPIITPRGSHLIQPVGLEKLIPSVAEAANHSGIHHFKFSMGAPGRIVPVTTGKVLTEVQAFAVLAGVKAYPIASGGVGGSEGCVCLTVEGEEEKVEKAFEVAKSVKGEPPVTLPEKYSISSAADYGYDAAKQYACLH